MSILVVCAGNTCRSPMAVGIARQILGPSVAIESAGSETADGHAATRHAVIVMNESGIDISSHQSRDLGTIDLAKFDLLIAMTPAIASDLRSRGVDPAKIEPLDVPDPYGKGLEVYRKTASAISHDLHRVLTRRGIAAST